MRNQPVRRFLFHQSICLSDRFGCISAESCQAILPAGLFLITTFVFQTLTALM